MNTPTLDEAVERGAEALAQKAYRQRLTQRLTLFDEEARQMVDDAIIDANEDEGADPTWARALSRAVLLAAGWEDLTAEVERLREELAIEQKGYRNLAQVRDALVKERDREISLAGRAIGEVKDLRDLCDELAEVVQDAYFRAGVNSYETRREIARAALAFYQERKESE